MSALPKGARQVIPFSGGLLVGVALFGLLPELAGEIGWFRGVPVFLAGYLLLMWLDRRFHGHAHLDVEEEGTGYTGAFTVPLKHYWPRSADTLVPRWLGLGQRRSYGRYLPGLSRRCNAAQGPGGPCVRSDFSGSDRVCVPRRSASARRSRSRNFCRGLGRLQQSSRQN